MSNVLFRSSRLRALAVAGFRLLFTGQLDVIFGILKRRFMPRRQYEIELISDLAANSDEVGVDPRYISDFDRVGSGSNNKELWGPVHDDLASGRKEPIVSVVIPCFNYGRFLDSAIDSVLSQTLSAVEIIVVEGGSTDKETTEIVKGLDRPKTRVIMQDKPTLVGANRNAGIAIATGRYICCLDADDTIDPTYLEKAVYLLDAHLYDIVSTGIRFTGAKSGTIDILEMPELRDMTSGNHVNTCAVFRRNLWEKVGGYFDTGKGQDHVAEDWDFWLRCAAVGARIRNITGEHLFNYMVHTAGSLSSTDVRSIPQQKIAILDRNRKLLSSEAFSHSHEQAGRRIRRIHSGTLSQVPHTTAGAKRSLLVAVPYLIVGGAERLLSTVVYHLASQGWTVTIVSTLPQEGHEDSSGWFKAASREIYMLPRFLKEWEYGSFIHYLIDSRRFDVALVAGSRVFYDLLPEIHEKYPELVVVDLLFNTVGHTHSHSEYLRQIDFAIAENPEVIAWFKSKGWADNGIKLIESGIDIARFRTQRSDVVSQELGIGENDIVIGFSGRLSDEKAPEVFLQIAEALRHDRRLRFIMTGGGPLVGAIDANIRELPADVRLDFVGMVKSTEEYFATYDIFVLPSRIDGRPMALLEALASGCAVVASDVGGIPAVLDGTGAGVLCKPANTEAFVAAIRSIVSDKKKLHLMKTAAREAAGRMLSEAQMGSAYENALEAAIRLKREKASVSANAVPQLRAGD